MGVKYEENERVSNKIERIPGVLKRGVWAFRPVSYDGSPTVNIAGEELKLDKL